MKNSRHAFLLLSHLVSSRIIKEFRRLDKAVEGLGSLFFLYHSKCNSVPSALNVINAYSFSDESLSRLNFPMIGSSLVHGHTHFPLFQFSLDNPDFDYYWLIEYDVRFSGNWRLFFDAFKDSSKDFITCHIRRHGEEPDWPWWALNHPQKRIPDSERLRSFNTVYRLSRSSVIFLHDALTDGWCGHHEVALPTLLYHNGFSIMDMGGQGDFTPPGMENRFYKSSRSNNLGELSSGTMRYRPSFWRAGLRKNMLYHPIKPLRFLIHEKAPFICQAFQRITACGSAARSLMPGHFDEKDNVNFPQSHTGGAAESVVPGNEPSAETSARIHRRTEPL